MKNIIIPVLTGVIVGATVYGVSYQNDPQALLEKQNKKKVLECIESLSSYTGSSSELQKEVTKCGKINLPTIGTLATGSTVVPPRGGSGSKDIQVACEWGNMEKVVGLEFHYTATDEETTLTSIKKSHNNKFGSEYIGYHYVIKPDGEIDNTRPEECVAGADKWERNNYRHIQIAFIGDDKPTYKQTESMAKLSKTLQIKYNIPVDSVSAHSEWGPKSKKESFEYWYGSKQEFIKKIRYYYVISIYGEGSPELQYMWRAWGDLDFIATIYQESRMNNDSVGDSGNSIGYCQIHKGYQPGWYNEYKNLTTMEERLNYCHEKYTYAKGLKGGVGSRFHGYNDRQKHKDTIRIE